jgi:RNA polymerase sigma-70 factor (ECF subfamily)
MLRESSGVLEERSDDELLLGWQQGLAAAGQVLFHRHYEAVRRFFRNKVPPAATRDLVQETFLACVESRERFRRLSSFRTYLLGIAHHVMVDYLRAAPRRVAAPFDLDDVILDDLRPAGEDAIAAKRERRLLLRALRRLRFPLQVVLELRYWESLSDQEIAEVLDEPLGTIKTRLRAGRLALEDRLAELSGSAEEVRSTLDSLHRWAARVRQAAVPDATRARDEPSTPG